MPPENGPIVVNPYIAGSPVKDAAMFFGREDVYAWLRQHLRGAYQDNVIVLFGERRSGKTSVLYQMNAGLGDDRYIPVLLDLQGMGLEGIDGFLWEVARKIVLALRSHHDLPQLARPARRDFEGSPRHQFEDIFLPQVLAALGQRRLLLMFDETDRLSEKVQSGRLPFDVFDYLRSLVQQVDQINFIFSLGRRIEIAGKGSSQLFNLAVYRKISFLDQDYAEDLITRPVAQHFAYTRASIDRILKLTAGQPYYTQLLCHNLFTRWTQDRPVQLAVADVEAVLAEVMEQGTPNFQFVWEDSTPVEKAVLAALAEAAPRHRDGVMRRNLDRTLRKARLYPPEGEVTGALKELFERDLINDKEPLELRVELVQVWLGKFKRLDWVREELGDIVQEWDKQEQQRRAQARATAERVRTWTAPVLAILLVGLLIVTYLLIANIQQVRQQSSAALDAAEARRVTEAAKLNATVTAAKAELERLESENNPQVVAARATAQAAEAMAAIALAEITATAAQAEILATGQAVAALAAAPTGTPVFTATPPPTASPTPLPVVTPTPSPSPTATPGGRLNAPLSGIIAYPAFNGTTYDIYFGDVSSGENSLYRREASQPAFSADGSRIAFQSWAGGSRGLVTASRNKGNEFLITNFLEDELPTWHPNGNTILFFSRRTGDRRAQFYRVQADVEFRNNPAQSLGIEGEYPAWGAAGGEIVFKGWGNTAPGLRLAPADFSALKNVTTTGEEFAPALSPDGRQVAYMARDEGNWDIYVVNADGSGLKRLTTDPAREGLPTWSPNGKVIAFVSERNGEWSIWAVNADGSFQQKLLSMAGSPDGIVFFDQANSTGWLEERLSWTP
ncbi:MAG: AAA family ATPase [Chloroflexota bacterium]